MKFCRLFAMFLIFNLKADGGTRIPTSTLDANVSTDVTASTTSSVKKGEKCVVLDAPILSVIDGVKGFMDGDKIHKMLFLGRELNQFMYGTLDVNNKRVPQYVFKDKYYTLEQLVAVEEEIEKSKDKDHAQYQKDKIEISKTLEKLKQDFLTFTGKVIGDAKGATEQTYMLIDNFMSKYGDSSLKYWRIDKDETASLHKRVTNFKLCFAMSFDLYHFLKAMICACPKAFQMYKDAQKRAALQNRF